MYYSCSSCGKEYSIAEKLYRCTCGEPLELEYDNTHREIDSEDKGRSIWRYKSLLGLPSDLTPISLGEGFTPVIKRRIEGTELFLKLDFLQPSGSFKDRGASVLISMVHNLGITEIVDDSSGNAGAAISAYSAAAGIKCKIFVPDYTPEGKLSQIRFYNADVVKVRGTRQDTNEAAVAASEHTYYASHLWNPLFSLGSASIAYELWEHFNGHLPAVVIVPLGGGGNLEGIYIGFKRLYQAGHIAHIPKIIGVQSANCSPIHTAYEAGLSDSNSEVDVTSTVAEGISVQNPPRARAVLEAIRGTQGFTLAVSEEEIISASRLLFSMGICVEPTSATVVAGWKKLNRALKKEAVLILTGSGLKETTKLSTLLST
ncbi:MAG: threonine synthase [Spirochaetia bacterium]